MGESVSLVCSGVEGDFSWSNDVIKCLIDALCDEDLILFRMMNQTLVEHV